jgi:hypothetical protein
MIDGFEVEIGGEKYIVPPLGMAGLKTLAAMQNAPGTENLSAKEQLVETAITTTHAALVRNYPDLQLEDVKERIHAWEILALYEVLPALYSKGGLERLREARKAKEAAEAAETAQAGQAGQPQQTEKVEQAGPDDPDRDAAA